MSKKRVAKRKVPRKGKQANDLLSPQSANTTDDIFENTEKLYKVFCIQIGFVPLVCLLLFNELIRVIE